MKSRFLATTAALSLAAVAQGQTARPQIKSISQSGARRGTSVQVTVTGTHIGSGTALRFEGEGLSVESLRAEPTPEGKLTAMVRIAPDAPLGRHALRVETPLGASDPGYLVVGQWPEAAEKEPNNARAQAQALEFPVTVIGRSDVAEDVDWYRLPMKQGETFVVEAQAGSIGSPMTPALSLYDAGGHEQASRSAIGGRDARLFFSVPRSGDYFLRVNDLRFQGGGDYLYRLTLGAIPYVTDIFPLGGPAGAAVNFALAGANLPGAAESRLRLAAEPGNTRLALPLPTGLSNLLDLEVGAGSEMFEAEPNDLPENAHRIPVPITLNGRIAPGAPGAPDADCFRFAATKGQIVLLDVAASRLGSPLDPVLSVLDTQGRELAANDDAGSRDAALSFTAPASGEYVVRISDLNGRSGPSFAYRLHVSLATPDFSLDFAPDCPILAPGDRIPFVVVANRRNGFDGDIALQIEGLPAGVAWLGEPVLRKGQNEANLLLTATAEAKGKVAAVSVRGTATIGGASVVRRARSLQEIYVKQGDQVVRTTRPTTLPLLTVAPFADAIVRVGAEALRLEAGKSVELLVQVDRVPHFVAKIPLIVRGLPPGVSVVNPEIPEKQNEVKLTFKAEGNAAPGTMRLLILARSVVDELHFSEHAAPPVALTVVK